MDLPCSARCWARQDAHIHAGHKNPKMAAHFAGLTDAQGRWTGTVRLDEAVLHWPLNWKRPRRIATAFGGDMFHPHCPGQARDRVLAIAALCPQHTFLLLTKRAKEMWRYLSGPATRVLIGEGFKSVVWFGNPPPTTPRAYPDIQLPLRNVLPGVSISTQAELDQRGPSLTKLAAMGWRTWISLEPLIEAVDVGSYLPGQCEYIPQHGVKAVVVGGETGKDARPIHPDWVRKVRDQCAEAGVAFEFKQWGEWVGGSRDRNDWFFPQCGPAEGRSGSARLIHWGGGVASDRVGRKAAGRLLDGREHNWMETPCSPYLQPEEKQDHATDRT